MEDDPLAMFDAQLARAERADARAELSDVHQQIIDLVGIPGTSRVRADRSNVQLMSLNDDVLWHGDLRSETLALHVARRLGYSVVLADRGTQRARDGSVLYCPSGARLSSPSTLLHPADIDG